MGNCTYDIKGMKLIGKYNLGMVYLSWGRIATMYSILNRGFKIIYH
jgi:hypothetical protein